MTLEAGNVSSALPQGLSQVLLLWSSQSIAMETGVEVQRDKNICRISPSVTVNSAGKSVGAMS